MIFWPGPRMRPRPSAANSIEAKQRLRDASAHLDDGARAVPISADRSEPLTQDRRLAPFISSDGPFAGSLINRLPPSGLYFGGGHLPAALRCATTACEIGRSSFSLARLYRR